MRQLKRIIVGHDLAAGGEIALRSAVVLANRFGAALRLKPLSSEAKTFLVPTDFSACAIKAAEEALLLAKRFSGRVVSFMFWTFLLHALPPMHMIWEGRLGKVY